MQLILGGIRGTFVILFIVIRILGFFPTPPSLVQKIDGFIWALFNKIATVDGTGFLMDVRAKMKMPPSAVHFGTRKEGG